MNFSCFFLIQKRKKREMYYILKKKEEEGKKQMQIIKYKKKDSDKERIAALLDSEKMELLPASEIMSIKQIATFAECSDISELNALKRRLDLPITKSLKYMRKREQSWSEDDVLSYDIKKEFPSFCALEIETASYGTICIHHAYLAHMQKPSFVDDMKKEIVE